MNWRRFLLCLVACVVSTSALRANDPSDVEGIISRIHREPVDSSAIATIGYSKRLHALEIEFRRGGTYRYLDVPPSLYHDLMETDSKARFYNQNVRHKFKSVHVRPRRE